MRVLHEYNSAFRRTTEHTRIDLGSIDFPLEGTPHVEAWSVSKGIDMILNEATGEWDGAHSTKPEPKKQAISSEHLGALKEALANVKGLAIPLEVSQIGICDGWSSTLTIESGFQTMTFHWFCDLPHEWAAIDAVVKAIVSARDGLEQVDNSG